MRRENPERAAEVLQLLGWNGGNQSGIAITSIDPLGDVHADQFSWNYNLGNVRDRPFSEIWPDRSDPRMAILKDRKSHLKGRCKSCRFLDVCNGNLRARAESYFGDFLAPDPACYLSDEEIGIEAGSPEAEQAVEWLVPVQQEAKAAT
jgi:radical SAM protein with 4Fe4S-binding SPASM domain